MTARKQPNSEKVRLVLGFLLDRVAEYEAIGRQAPVERQVQETHVAGA